MMNYASSTFGNNINKNTINVIIRPFPLTK